MHLKKRSRAELLLPCNGLQGVLPWLFRLSSLPGRNGLPASIGFVSYRLCFGDVCADSSSIGPLLAITATAYAIDRTTREGAMGDHRLSFYDKLHAFQKKRGESTEVGPACLAHRPS